MEQTAGPEGSVVKYCCNECKNKDCPVNYKNAPKGAPIQLAALCGSKQCMGYKRP